MSRKAVLTTLAIYLVVALAFGFFSEFIDPSASDLKPIIWISGMVGGALGALIISGILPLIFWAFGRFRADNLTPVFFAWAILGLGFMGTATAGNLYGRQNALGDLASNVASLFDDDRGAFVRAAKRSCVNGQRKNPLNRQVGITEQQIEAYCGCFADSMGRAVSADDIEASGLNGKMTPAVVEKARRIAPMCSKLALGR